MLIVVFFFLFFFLVEKEYEETYQHFPVNSNFSKSIFFQITNNPSNFPILMKCKYQIYDIILNSKIEGNNNSIATDDLSNFIKNDNSIERNSNNETVSKIYFDIEKYSVKNKKWEKVLNEDFFDYVLLKEKINEEDIFDMNSEEGIKRVEFVLNSNNFTDFSEGEKINLKFKISSKTQLFYFFFYLYFLFNHFNRSTSVKFQFKTQKKSYFFLLF
jgi:hypothetical protein